MFTLQLCSNEAAPGNYNLFIEMKHRRDFEIPYVGLKEGMHHFQFEIDDSFLEVFNHDHQDFDGLKAVVKLNFDKKSNFFLLDFDIDGKINVACDRCGDPFELRLWDEFKLVVKLQGEGEKEDEDDVVFIPRSETVLDVAEWIYEFIMLSIPIQHIHPDKEDGSEGCNPEALKLLKKMTDNAQPAKTIWKGLDAFKGDTDLKQ